MSSIKNVGMCWEGWRAGGLVPGFPSEQPSMHLWNGFALCSLRSRVTQVLSPVQVV